MDDAEVERIAAFLEMPVNEFIQRFTRLRTDRRGLSLVEKDGHECVMLEGDACRIHEVKPAQCGGFPNRWNFPGWRDVCDAVPVPVNPGTSQPPA